MWLQWFCAFSTTRMLHDASANTDKHANVSLWQENKNKNKHKFGIWQKFVRHPLSILYYARTSMGKEHKGGYSQRRFSSPALAVVLPDCRRRCCWSPWPGECGRSRPKRGVWPAKQKSTIYFFSQTVQKSSPLACSDAMIPLVSLCLQTGFGSHTVLHLF